jgi:signal transduction histidine kinase
MREIPPGAGEGWLYELGPTRQQQRLVVIIVAALLVGAAALAPFGNVVMLQVPAFIPTLSAVIFISDLITAILLFSYCARKRSRALMVLAAGQLFSSLIVIPHALAFPGAFTATGLFGAGSQTTAWLYIVWHSAFPMALLAYGLLRNDQRQLDMPIWLVATLVVLLVIVIAGGVIAMREDLPVIVTAENGPSLLSRSLLVLELLACCLALLVLWRRRRSVLDLWLMVVAVAMVLELMFVGVISSGRFTLAFYLGRLFAICTSTIVLLIILIETAQLYTRLAHSNALLERERNNRLLTLEATIASVAHEVNQPLGAIMMNAGAALRFLADEPPNVQDARISVEAIITDSERASGVFDNIRALILQDTLAHGPVDLNATIAAALAAHRLAITSAGIEIRSRLAPEAPFVLGHAGQLEEVFANLVQNAIEALRMVTEGPRFLTIGTARDGKRAIASVEDNGVGIQDAIRDHMFDPFVSDKRDGTGLGLAISRLIIERHGGEISAGPATPRGAIFVIALPTL